MWGKWTKVFWNALTIWIFKSFKGLFSSSHTFTPSKQKDVLVWLMLHIMLPADTLLHSKRSPLFFTHQSVLWNRANFFFGNMNMSIFKMVIRILVGVVEAFMV